MRTRRLLITADDLLKPPSLPSTPLAILGYYGLRTPGPVDRITISRGGKHTKEVELSGWVLTTKHLGWAIKRMEECGYTVVNKESLLKT